MFQHVSIEGRNRVFGLRMEKKGKHAYVTDIVCMQDKLLI
jgi:hypothetical protein